MYFASVQRLCKLTLALSLLVAAGAGAAGAQGLMEYGGLMAMPKGVPGGDTVQNLTRGFGAIPNALPGQSGQAAPVIPASVAMVRPDGTVTVDPKKVAAATAKANADQNQAKAILAKATATPAELKEAEKHLRAAITLRNSIWGYQDPNIPKLLNQLGSTYERMKQPATAKTCYQNAVTYVNKKYGFGSPERLDSFICLTPILLQEGELSEALSLQQQIAMIKERKSGATSLDTIEARLAWAGTAKALDKPNAADIYKQCLTDLDKAGSKITPEQTNKLKAEILPPYLETLKKQGRDDEAKEAASLLSTLPAAPAAQAPAQGSATATAAPTAGAAPQSGVATAQPGTASGAANLAGTGSSSQSNTSAAPPATPAPAGK
jgi:tetratricopeptide (TPR) repeat protein